MEWEWGGATEAEFLDGIQTSILWFFLFVIHSHLYSFALRFLFLQTHATLTVSVNEKGGKPERKPYPLPYGFRNTYRILKSENSQDYAQKPDWNCTLMNSASGFQSFTISQSQPAGAKGGVAGCRCAHYWSCLCKGCCKFFLCLTMMKIKESGRYSNRKYVHKWWLRGGAGGGEGNSMLLFNMLQLLLGCDVDQKV